MTAFVRRALCGRRGLAAALALWREVRPDRAVTVGGVEVRGAAAHAPLLQEGGPQAGHDHPRQRIDPQRLDVVQDLESLAHGRLLTNTKGHHSRRMPKSVCS